MLTVSKDLGRKKPRNLVAGLAQGKPPRYPLAMPDLVTRIARCFCGDFTATIRGEPVFVSSCACTRCQRRTGAFYGVTVYVRPDQVVARTGEGQSFRPDGGASTLHRCARCGTTLWWTLDEDDSIVGLAGGCFADQGLPAPQRMVFTATRHPFVRTPEGLPEYSDGPPE